MGEGPTREGCVGRPRLRLRAETKSALSEMQACEFKKAVGSRGDIYELVCVV